MPDKPNIATQLFHDLGVISPAEAEARYGQSTVPTYGGDLRLSFVKPPSEDEKALAAIKHQDMYPPETEPYALDAPGTPYALVAPKDEYRRALVEYPVSAAGGSEAGALDEARAEHLERIRAYAQQRVAEVDAVPEMGPYQIGSTLQRYRDLMTDAASGRAKQIAAKPDLIDHGVPVKYTPATEIEAMGLTSYQVPEYDDGQFAEPSVGIDVASEMSPDTRERTLLHERMHARAGTAAEPTAYPTVNKTSPTMDWNNVQELDKRIETAVASRYARLRAFEQDLYRMTQAVKHADEPHRAQRALLRHGR